MSNVAVAVVVVVVSGVVDCVVAMSNTPCLLFSSYLFATEAGLLSS